LGAQSMPYQPETVSRSVNSSGDQLKSTYCLSQLRVTFMKIIF